MLTRSLMDQISQLISDFRNAAIEKGDFAYGRRDAQLYEVMRRSYLTLKKSGKEGSDAFAILLGDNSVLVRGWVAAALLVEGNSQAHGVLEAIARDESSPSFDARVTLDEFA